MFCSVDFSVTLPFTRSFFLQFPVIRYRKCSCGTSKLVVILQTDSNITTQIEVTLRSWNVSEGQLFLLKDSFNYGASTVEKRIDPFFN